MSDINQSTISGHVFKCWDSRDKGGPLKLVVESCSYYRDKQGSKKETRLRVVCSCWGQSAEGLRVGEGDYVVIGGRLRSEKTQRQTSEGKDIYELAIDAATVTRCGAPSRLDDTTQDSPDPW